MKCACEARLFIRSVSKECTIGRKTLLVIVAALLLAACLSVEPQSAIASAGGEVTAPPYEAPSSAETPPQEEVLQEPPSEESLCIPARVIRVIDGDTLDVVLEGGASERVRLVGVDTPETKAPEEPEEYGVPDTQEGRECLRRWGYEAYRYVLNLQDTEVCLVLAGRGYYGRLLAYVYTSRDDTTPLGYELVEKGLARVYTEADFAFEEEYIQAEQLAKNKGLGLWGCASQQTQESGTTTQEECDPSYPDVCIPPQPPDLDCKDVPYRNFKVLPPDPHRFDRDRDGIGCES